MLLALASALGTYCLLSVSFNLLLLRILSMRTEERQVWSNSRNNKPDGPGSGEPPWQQAFLTGRVQPSQDNMWSW